MFLWLQIHDPSASASPEQGSQVCTGVILHTGLEEGMGALKRRCALRTGSAGMLGVVFTVRAVDSSGTASCLYSEPGNPGLLALRELCSGEEHWCTRVIQINSLDLFTKTLGVMFMGEVSRVKN